MGTSDDVGISLKKVVCILSSRRGQLQGCRQSPPSGAARGNDLVGLLSRGASGSDQHQTICGVFFPCSAGKMGFQRWPRSWSYLLGLNLFQHRLNLALIPIIS